MWVILKSYCCRHKSAAVAPLWLPHHAYRMALPYATAEAASCLINQAQFGALVPVIVICVIQIHVGSER